MECSYEISDTLKMLVIDKATLGNNGKFGWFFVVMKMNVYQRFKVDDSGNSLGFNSEDSTFSLPRAQVWHLVRKLTSHKPCSVAKKKKKNRKKKN